MGSEQIPRLSAAGLSLPWQNHICAFFHDLDEEYCALLPFIKQGMGNGEKAFHIVDAQLRTEHLRRLEVSGIDVRSATEKNQLEVRPWEETYLRTQKFDQQEMGALIDDTLRSARSDGFVATRIIAHVEWILQDRQAIEDFFEFEARLNYLLSNSEDSVICVYTSESFDPSIVMDMLRTHPAVMISGVIQRNPFFVPPDQFLDELHHRQAGTKPTDNEFTAESLRLRHAIRDLIALSGLSAKLNGKQPCSVAWQIGEILRKGLRLEATHVRLKCGRDDSYIDAPQADRWSDFGEWHKQIETCGEGSNSSASERRGQISAANGTLNMLQIPIGTDNQAGYIAAGSTRPDFPSEMEMLVLSVATNQGLICYRNECLIIERDRVQIKFEVLNEEIERSAGTDEIQGSSLAVKKERASIAKVAPTDSTVLITGETGTGKELVARAVHKLSTRHGQPFISVHCAALPETLIATELFGHEKGAFTGAQQRRLGRFELANEGTVFLDEIGELSLDTQVALLRVLQERVIERVGGGRPISINVRVIAATNRDLRAAVAKGAFRADLFYRLNVFPIEVPPLRERKEDIPILVRSFVHKYASALAKKIRRIDAETMKLLQAYNWPGNIRELENVVERSIILCEGDSFSVDESWLAVDSTHDKFGPMSEKMVGYEREIIEKALLDAEGKVSGANGAADRLGIPASTLESRIKALGINKFKFKSA